MLDREDAVPHLIRDAFVNAGWDDAAFPESVQQNDGPCESLLGVATVLVGDNLCESLSGPAAVDIHDPIPSGKWAVARGNQTTMRHYNARVNTNVARGMA